MANGDIKTKPGSGVVDGMVRRIAGERWDSLLGVVTYEVWQGDRESAENFYTDKKGDGNWHHVDISGTEGSTIRNVRLEVAADPEGWDPTLNSTWEILPVEIHKDLRAHPYWRTSAGFDLLPDFIQCDNAIQRGEIYDPTTSLKDVGRMKQYYGLRLSGVDSYTEYGLDIFSTIMISSKGSSATVFLGGDITVGAAPTSGSALQAEYDDVNRVVAFADIGVPDDVVIYGIDTIKRLKRFATADGGCTLDMDTDVYPHYTDAQYEASKWEWLKCMPSVRTERAGKRFQVSRRWRGAMEISAVLYGGNWNPKYPA